MTLRPAKVETPVVTFALPSNKPLPDEFILPLTLPTKSPVKVPATNEFAVHTPVIATLPVTDNLSVGFVMPIPKLPELVRLIIAFCTFVHGTPLH